MTLGVLGDFVMVRSLMMVCITYIPIRCGLTLRTVGDDRPLPYQVDIRPSQEFSYEGGKTKLINIESTIAHNDVATFLVPGEASTYEDEQDHENFGSTNRQGKLLRLSSWIDFENQIGIGCMGAVLTHLQRRRAAGYLPDDPNDQWAFRVRSLEMVTLQDTMYVCFIVGLKSTDTPLAGSLALIRCLLCKSSSPSPILMHSIRVRARQARKSHFPYTDCSTTTLVHPKVKPDCARSFFDQVCK